jgi:hypothetical protein
MILPYRMVRYGLRVMQEQRPRILINPSLLQTHPQVDDLLLHKKRIWEPTTNGEEIKMLLLELPRHDQYQVIRQTILLLPQLYQVQTGSLLLTIISGEEEPLRLPPEHGAPYLLETKRSCKVHVLQGIMSQHRKNGVMLSIHLTDILVALLSGGGIL